MSFSKYWTKKWKENNLPELLNTAFRQMSEDAWNAGIASMADWQPIATAPKDGTRVDLMNAENGYTDFGFWFDYRGNIQSPEGEWSTDLGNGDMTHWRLPAGDDQ